LRVGSLSPSFAISAALPALIIVEGRIFFGPRAPIGIPDGAWIARSLELLFASFLNLLFSAFASCFFFFLSSFCRFSKL
jgi:hypothetical protein